MKKTPGMSRQRRTARRLAERQGLIPKPPSASVKKWDAMTPDEQEQAVRSFVATKMPAVTEATAPKKPKVASRGRCRDCNEAMHVPVADWHRASSPRCTRCGGILDRIQDPTMPKYQTRKGPCVKANRGLQCVGGSRKSGRRAN